MQLMLRAWSRSRRRRGRRPLRFESTPYFRYYEFAHIPWALSPTAIIGSKFPHPIPRSNPNPLEGFLKFLWNRKHVGRDLGVVVKTCWYIRFSESHDSFVILLFDASWCKLWCYGKFGKHVGNHFWWNLASLKSGSGRYVMCYGSTCYGILNEFCV